MNMKKLLIIGSSGLVGYKFASSISSDRKVAPNEIELDITDEKIVNDFFEIEKDNFDVVVNFAGFTNVDAAEKERGDENGFCYKLNVKGAENLAKASLKYDKFLIQISTDFVFNGTPDYPGPYSEESSTPDKLTEKMGWYGWTKNRSEFVVKNSGCKYAIVRIAYPFYGENYDLKLDYAKNYLKLFDEGKLFPIFTDQILTPLLIDDLTPALEKIIEIKQTGVYHVVSSDTTTPFEFVSYLLEKARGVTNVVKKGSMEEFLKVEGRTPRSRLGGLKTEITQEKLGIKFKTWREMVDEFIKRNKV